MENNNLPMKVNNLGLTIEKRRNVSRINNSLKRIGKIGIQGLVAIGGIGIAAIIGGPVGMTVGLGTYIVGANGALKNAIYRREKDMMFITRVNSKGETAIFQDATNIKMLSQMKGYEPHEKAALMGLQNLVGLQRYKQEFSDKNKKKELSRDSENHVYNKVFSTLTHGINIKTFQALESLGYIQIESLEDKRSRLLIMERLGFGQYNEAKESIKAMITNNQDAKNKYMRQMKKISFKLTDKPLDLNELYEQYEEVKNTRGNNPNRKDIRRIGIILEALKDKNVDISVDKLGISRINYKAKTSLAKRIEQEIAIKQEKQRFKEELSDFKEQELSQEQHKAIEQQYQARREGKREERE